MLEEVEAFAQGEYTTALMKGAALTAKERAAIIKRLARYTGLSPDYIDRVNLRTSLHLGVSTLLFDVYGASPEGKIQVLSRSSQ